MQSPEGDPGLRRGALLLRTGPQREGGQSAGESGPGAHAHAGEAEEPGAALGGRGPCGPWTEARPGSASSGAGGASSPGVSSGGAESSGDQGATGRGPC